MAHELNRLIDCQFNPVTLNDQIVTIQAINATPPTTNAGAILASSVFGEGIECVSTLIAPVCDGFIPSADSLQIGSDAGGFPQWEKGDWFQTTFNLVTVGTINTNVDGIDLYYYNGPGVGTWNIEEPISDCSRNHVWVKNRSASSLTISAVSGTIDGGASKVVLAGAGVHLTWIAAFIDWVSI